MKPTITLCMIVKNESHVILECLNSVWKHINYWVISDTGSTDNTKELIETFFREKGIPGEFADLPWKDFGHNKSHVLAACRGKADYAWHIDADDYLVDELPQINDLTVDCYKLKIKYGGLIHYREQIFKLESDWDWVGVLHEWPKCKKENPIVQRLEGSYNIQARIIGGRSVGITDKEKYERDAITLEEALKTEPENSRYWFYLGQSYYDSGNWTKSKRAYLRCTELDGWHSEKAFAYYRAGICQEWITEFCADQKAIELYLKAYETEQRPEFLWQISRLFYLKYKEYHKAYIYLKIAYDTAYPENSLFPNAHICKYNILDDISIVAPFVGENELAKTAIEKLLTENRQYIPNSELGRILNNYKILTNKEYKISTGPKGPGIPTENFDTNSDTFVPVLTKTVIPKGPVGIF